MAFGRIKELVNNRDGQVRSAKIVLPNNKGISRPLNLWFPIELNVLQQTKLKSQYRAMMM